MVNIWSKFSLENIPTRYNGVILFVEGVHFNVYENHIFNLCRLVLKTKLLVLN